MLFADMMVGVVLADGRTTTTTSSFGAPTNLLRQERRRMNEFLWNSYGVFDRIRFSILTWHFRFRKWTTIEERTKAASRQAVVKYNLFMETWMQYRRKSATQQQQQ